MRVGGERWNIDVEARLDRETPWSFAQTGGRRATSCDGPETRRSAQDFLRLDSVSRRRKEAIDMKWTQILGPSGKLETGRSV